MYSKLCEFVKKYWDLIVYLLFGILTTAVNYIVYLPLLNVFLLPGSLSNVIAWIAAVVFAFLTNKPFVFKSRDWSANVVIPELIKFVGSRIGSGLAETVIIFLTVDILDWNGNVWKMITSIFVVVLNYISSKMFVFRNEK